MTEEDLRSLEQKFNNMPIDERIDNLLIYLQNSNNLFLTNKPLADIFNHLFSSSYPIDEDKFFGDVIRKLRESLAIMIYNDLIYFKSNEFSVKNPKPDILPKGIAINAKGGWLKHIQEIKEEKSILQKQAQSVIDLAKLIKENQKSQEDTNKTSRRIGWSAVFVALISAIATAGQWSESINSRNEKRQTFQSYHKAHSHCKASNKALKKISGDTISARRNHSK